tara:strand:+ start:9963 stop:10595 length:633 start_codon:yes stop_codon:yes gene_type:complete
MASNSYMTGRKKYARPQGMLWSEDKPLLENGFYLPQGYEINSASPNEALETFMILSDHNRAPLEFKINRIENRQRTINGTMRSYHVADKVELTTSWTMLPSRSFKASPEFDPASGKSSMTGINNEEYTVDGGSGGAELLDWYENNKGSFWVSLAYDKYTAIDDSVAEKYSSLNRYNHVVEMFISDFSYSVEKRGGSNFDFWNVSVTLEEV